MTDSVAAVETALAAEEFIVKIWQERRRFVREGRIKQPHPWQVALSQGRVSKAALIEYVKNRYYFLCNINRKDAQIIANAQLRTHGACCYANISMKKARTSLGAVSGHITRCG